MSTLEDTSIARASLHRQQGTMPCFFVLSCGRSGSTMLRSMLACNPRICIPRPSHFIVESYFRFRRADLSEVTLARNVLGQILDHERAAEYELDLDSVLDHFLSSPHRTLPYLLRSVFESNAAKHGAQVWGDRTTTYGAQARIITQCFPDAKVVHLVRDGRDVALSLVENGFADEFLAGLAAWSLVEKEIERCRLCLPPEQFLRIRFEDLVREPETTLRRVCEFLATSYDEAMLSYSNKLDELLVPEERPIHRKLVHQPLKSEAFKWKEKLRDDQVRASAVLAGRLLAGRGYERTPGSWSLRASLGFHRALWRSALRQRLHNYRSSGGRVPAPIRGAVRGIVDYANGRRLSACFARPHATQAAEVHVDSAMAWLCRAQDDGPDDGVARSARIGGTRFDASYPETTGYVIPTFLARFRETGDEALLTRARKMGDWEIEIQMRSGAVKGGTIRWHSRPAVFNTGQVMQGWNALYRVTSDQRYLDAAIRAGRWLVSIQEPDGNWVRGHSVHAQVPEPTYNTRVAWPLAEIETITNLSSVGRKWVILIKTKLLRLRRANGWRITYCGAVEIHAPIRKV